MQITIFVLILVGIFIFNWCLPEIKCVKVVMLIVQLQAPFIDTFLIVAWGYLHVNMEIAF